MRNTPGQKQSSPQDSPAGSERSITGARLKLARKGKGYSLQQLAQASGVAISTISKIENGKMSPSIDIFLKITRALDEPGPSGSGLPPRPRQDSFVGSGNLHAGQVTAFRSSTHALIGPLPPGHRLTPVLLTFRERNLAEAGPPVGHGGQEFVLVLRGAVEIVFEGRESLKLTQWDTAYFDSTVPHVYLKAGRGVAEVLVVAG